MRVYILLGGTLALGLFVCSPIHAQSRSKESFPSYSTDADLLAAPVSPRLSNTDSNPSQVRIAPSSTLAQAAPTEGTDPERDPEIEAIPLLDISLTEELLRQPLYAPFRREGTLGETSRPAYVITRDQIEAQGARTVQEALTFLPGLISDGTAGGQLGALSSQFMRGANSAQVLILLDGRPINDIGFFGGFDLSEITTNAVERVEVIPGGGSALYGSDAIGGVINIVTRDPGGRPEFNLQLEAGSFGLDQQEVEWRGQSEPLGWVLGYKRIEAENDFRFRIDSIDLEATRENAEVLYNNLNLKLNWELGDRERLTFSSLYLTKDLGIPGGVSIPGSLGEFNTLTPLAQQNTQSWLNDLSYQTQLGQGFDSQLTARLYVDVLQQEFNNPDPSTFGTLDDIDRTAFGLQLQHDWQITPRQNVTYGLDYRRVSATNTTFDYSTETSTTNYDGEISQGALFASYEIYFSREVQLNLGLRQDLSSLVNGSVTSPSAGVRWAVGDSTVVRANYARSFRAPLIVNLEGLASFNVEGNRDLKPERGNSLDVGIDQQLGDQGLLQLTYYWNEIEDQIAFEFGDPSTYVNIGRVQAEGLEASLTWQLAENWFGFANYTLNDPRIRESQNAAEIDQELAFIGADSFNVGIAYESPQGFYAGILLHQISERFVDNANTERLPSYTTVDLNVRIPIYAQWVLSASVENLFDEQYQVFPGFPGVGSQVRLGLGSTF